MIAATLRLRILLDSVIALGPGKANLLEAIAHEGSISAAARRMGMSYRRAWVLVDTMNHSFREPLVDTAAGGRGGGGASVTPLGETVLRHYRAMETKAWKAIAPDLETVSSLLKKPAPPKR